MNLSDLRDELTTRAGSVDSVDLRAGVRARIRRTKRRRVVGSLTAAVAVTAVVATSFAVLPTLTGRPGPAAGPPPDFTRDGITLPGRFGDAVLESPTIGAVGQTVLTTTWTPTSRSAGLFVHCDAAGVPSYVVQIGGRTALEGVCNTEWQPGVRVTALSPVEADAPLWLDVPLNQATTVTLRLVDSSGATVEDNSIQLGLGIYRRENPAPPSSLGGAVTPASDPADLRTGGLTFRARAGGDTRLAAVAGRPGDNRVTTSFISTGRPIVLRDFCTANDLGLQEQYELRVLIDGRERSRGCAAASTDVAGPGSSGTFPNSWPTGRRVDVVAELIDQAGRPVTVPGVRLAVALYAKGPQRVVDGVSLDEVKEHDGGLYRLAEVRTADAASQREITLPSPADRPYLVTYGSSPLGTRTAITGELTGLKPSRAAEDQEIVQLSAHLSNLGGEDGSWGLATDGNAGGPSAPLTLRIIAGTPTRGQLILAVYVPAR